MLLIVAGSYTYRIYSSTLFILEHQTRPHFFQRELLLSKRCNRRFVPEKYFFFGFTL